MLLRVLFAYCGIISSFAWCRSLKHRNVRSTIDVVVCEQSPININTESTTPDYSPELVFSNYNKCFQGLRLKNTGNTVTVLAPQSTNLTISGGGLNAKYQLQQVHFHWTNQDYQQGYGHSIDNGQKAIEIHFVHTKFGHTLEEAKRISDGLVIIVVLCTTGLSIKVNVPHMFTKQVRRIHDYGSETRIEDVSSLLGWLPNDRHNFYRYRSSTTAGDCSESVNWIVMKTHMIVHTTQLSPFRKIRNERGEKILENARLQQETNGREIHFHTSDGSVGDILNAPDCSKETVVNEEEQEIKTTTTSTSSPTTSTTSPITSTTSTSTTTSTTTKTSPSTTSTSTTTSPTTTSTKRKEQQATEKSRVIVIKPKKATQTKKVVYQIQPSNDYKVNVQHQTGGGSYKYVIVKTYKTPTQTITHHRHSYNITYYVSGKR